MSIFAFFSFYVLLTLDWKVPRGSCAEIIVPVKPPVLVLSVFSPFLSVTIEDTPLLLTLLVSALICKLDRQSSYWRKEGFFASLAADDDSLRFFLTKSEVSMRFTLLLTSFETRSLLSYRSFLDNLVAFRLALKGLSSVKSILVNF